MKHPFDQLKQIASNVFCSNKGQATVEAAFVVPLFLTAILLLAQPGIILYDRMVMEAAASEGCRMLATNGAGAQGVCRDFVLRRLGAVPPHDLFHVHSSGCSWDVRVEGSEAEGTAAVSIENKVKPLPLIGLGVGFLGLLDADGCLPLSVEASCDTQPSWVSADQFSEGPAAWIGGWVDD